MTLRPMTLAVIFDYAMNHEARMDGVNGNESNNEVFGGGAVYVFARDPSGAWAQHAYLKASNGDEFVRFSNSMALDGDTLTAGAFFEDSNAMGLNGGETSNDSNGSGAVYVRRIAP